MKKILVLDDDEEILKLMNLLLPTYGFKVVTIWNWKDLFKNIEYFEPDLIMIDYILSGNNGQDLYRKIKQMNISTPVLIFSAMEEAGKVINCKTDGFIEKPFEVPELLDKIKKLIGGKQRSKS